MIVPTKHVRTERALIGVGANILDILRVPMTMSGLWDEARKGFTTGRHDTPIDYHWFVLALDLLFLLDAIEVQRGLLQRSKS